MIKYFFLQIERDPQRFHPAIFLRRLTQILKRKKGEKNPFH